MLQQHTNGSVFATILDLVFFAIPWLGPFLAFLVWVYPVYAGLMTYKGRDIRLKRGGVAF